jgi:uncharacterized protein (UPF0264 family)
MVWLSLKGCFPLPTVIPVETSIAGPRLLISVRSPQEALAAIQGGADIIDVKEPQHGSLGRASAAVIADIARTIDVLPLSAALGELREPLDSAELQQIVRHVGWVKVGLSGLAHADWRSRWLELCEQIREISPEIKLIAVVYADAKTCGAPAAEDVISAALSADVPGVLFDTYEKQGRSLLDSISRREISDGIEDLHAAGRFVALAGSINLSHLEDLLELRPDIIAVRSAVCRGDRTSAVDADLVARFRGAMHPLESRL